MTTSNIYNYLAEGIVEYFKRFTLTTGQSYQAQFELTKDVNGLYNALKEKGNSHNIFSEFNFGEFKSFILKFESTSLLIAANINGVNEDYLTALRNYIKSQEGEFSGLSILFIHNTQLDSIIGGAANISSSGYPLSLDYVKERIEKSVSDDDEQNSTITKFEKKILSELLKNQDKEIGDISRSIFDYSIYLEILEKGQISNEDYPLLGLFKDNSIIRGKVNEKEIDKRIKENQKVFTEIRNGHQYGNIDSVVEKKFDELGQKKLKNKDTWQDVTFEDVVKSEESRKNIEGIQFRPNDKNITTDNLKCRDIEDGTSKAKQRTRNIFIFNPDHHQNIQYELLFDKKPNQKFIKQDKDNVLKAEVNPTEKSLVISISLNDASIAQVGNRIEYNEVENGKTIKHIFKFAVLPFDQEVIEDQISTLKINKNALEISSDSDIIINPNHQRERKDVIVSNQKYLVEENETLYLRHGDETHSDTGKLKFDVEYGNAQLSYLLVLADLKPKVISASNVINTKLQSKDPFLYSERIDSSKEKLVQSLEHNLHKYYPSERLKKQLTQEFKIFIQHKENNPGYLSYNEALDGKTLTATDLKVDEEVKLAYKALIEYFNKKSKKDKYLLPSLTVIDEELKELYQTYLKVIQSSLDGIKEGDELNLEEENLLKIGTIISEDREKFIKFTSLHPLNVAYQLLLKENVDSDLPKEIISKLNSDNLLPYLRGKKNTFYHVIENEDSILWNHYVKEETEGQTATNRFVPKLLQEKIIEFTDHFSFLFLDANAPIKVNLINQGDCSEILLGIFRYFNFLISKRNKTPEDISPIDFTIYGSDDYITKFEQLSKYDNPEQIKSVFGIDLFSSQKKIDAYELLKLYHNKVNFFTKKKSDTYEYAHISFYQFIHDEGNLSDVSYAHNEMDKMDSGLSLGGVLSETATAYDGGAYWSSYGTKKGPKENSISKLSTSYNQVANVLNSPNKLEFNKTIALTIDKEVKGELEKIYESSQWTTFIDPKVDLSFFKEDNSVVIIHYSDLYTSNSGYDAITVTKKWEQYRDVILNYLKKNQLEVNEDDTIPIINMFNAINGDWLLKIAAHNQRYQMDKEKISVLSAVKEMMAILEHPSITWVPMSLEEILRVSGSVALPQNSLMSVKSHGKSGMYSDDLLMVGVEETSNGIELYFHPVEVKIGKTNQENKALKQGAKTAEFFEEVLGGDNFKNKVYRNFFAKQIITIADKLRLYQVWEDYNEKWKNLHELKGKLYNDEFIISQNINEIVGKYSVLSFKANDSFQARSIKLDDDALIIELLESDGLNDLKTTMDDLIERYHDDEGDCSIHCTLLRKAYSIDKNLSGFEEHDIETTSTSDYVEKETNDNESTPSPTLVEEPIITEPMKILFGTKSNTKEELYWYPTSTDKVMHTNTGIIGTMGTGKTQFTKSMILQLSKNAEQNVDGKKIGILIFDYKGDYIKEDFTKPTDAKVYELYHLPYNPLALAVGSTTKPMLPLHTASALENTISTAYNLGNKQRSFLKELLMQAYENKGIIKHRRDTWEQPSPTLHDVYRIFEEHEDFAQDSLNAALKELYDYEIFEPNGKNATPLFDLIDGVTVINLSGYSPQIQNLVVAITLDQFYSQMQNRGHSKIDGNFRQLNKMILVDEADNFLSKNFESLRKILKEGREYGVGTILSTQFLNHFSTGDNEYSNYILTWIIHRVNEIKDKEVSSLFDLPSRNDRDDLIGVIKGLEKHYSIVNNAGSAPIKIRDKAFWEWNNN
ncbi:type IV secretion system DNA-binding domain-containing protein [Flammeovirga agarivorans]|uniref:Type IV secretion system coupling protein TraD DNA-binding domain-containing protein n=1 Tax=Flammeovirga agarivorans TaxID=2726742 RepID=A0A7X8SKI1_9BACT|nr:type IV secretion system DNA-binding domain-containing protein [Flammeovirga agarivorans]NLR91916.1 hypothetical protein [Flammeovirga agarivorans]